MIWDDAKSGIENTYDEYVESIGGDLIIFVIIFIISGIIYYCTK